MSSTIELSPPPAAGCLETSRRSRYRGGTQIAEDVHDLEEHLRRMSAPDLYRPASCGNCGGGRLHVHTRPERRPRGEPSLPAVVEVLQYRCAKCRATWRMLPLFLARHLWHAWTAVERTVGVSGPTAATPRSPPIRRRTANRWRARLASSARFLVVLLAASGGAELEELAKEVGLVGMRAELVVTYTKVVSPRTGERLASLGALLDRLERGIRLM